MNILIINGSPKGDYSCTLQTALFLQKKMKSTHFTFLNAGKMIRKLERDFGEAEALIDAADVLLFCYPVYTFIAPSQLHRFIELMKEHYPAGQLAGKFATQLTTSKHFYDVTAHNFIQENCQDLGLKFIKGLSADMDDLTTKKGQEDAVAFGRYLMWCVKHDVHEPAPAAAPSAPKHVAVTVPSAVKNTAAGPCERKHVAVTVPEKRSAAIPAEDAFAKKVPENGNVAAAGPVSESRSVDTAGLVSKSGKKIADKADLTRRKTIAVVADLAPEDMQLKMMIDRFAAVMTPYEIRLVNIHDFPFKGGCISCFNCAVDGTCIYKDGFSDLLRNQIQTCSAIVIAFSIRDHSMGSVFKTYDDRQFCNGHRTVTMGMPFGYLVSGDYSREKNLQMIIEGRAEVGGSFLAGVATDEFDPDGEIDTMARRLDYAVRHHYVQPANFLGVGGMKIFRDLIWLMQGMMKADHKFYKAHNQYDFPQKKRGTMLAMYLVGAMISNPDIKKKMGNKMNEGMLAPYKKVLEQTE